MTDPSSLVFLALAVWREARGEAPSTQLGVAYSILNRVAKPSWWGSDVMSVVFKKWQYSSFTDPHDPQLTKWPRADAVWQIALRAAEDALTKFQDNPVPGADSYFDISISPPFWATPDRFVGALGRLRFYNVDADHEFPA